MQRANLVRGGAEPDSIAARTSRAVAGRPASTAAIIDFEYWRSRTIGGVAKRVFDLIAAGVAIVALAPLLLTVALAVKLHDGGPVLFSQPRVGRGGRMFGCLKFRTMVVDAERALEEYLARDEHAAREWRRSRKLLNDPRITKLGAFLRQTSLDELPQLFNVLKGEMSMVGPRPVVPDELQYYGLKRIHYLSARPGLTGLWQVAGRSVASYKDRVAWDADYVRRWSLLLDIAICFRTVPAVLLRRGAY